MTGPAKGSEARGDVLQYGSERMTGDLEDTSDLLVGPGDCEDLLVAPRKLAEEVRASRAALRGSRTWGDAYRLLSAERVEELRDRLTGLGGPRPADDQPLDLTDLHAKGEWPRLYYSQVARWLPDDVVARFGERYDGLMDSGVNLPAEDQDAVVAELARRGVRCTHDHDLDELFIGSEVD